MGKDGPTFPCGSNFSQGEGFNCIFLYKPIEFVIFQGAGVRTPAPSSDQRRFVQWDLVLSPTSNVKVVSTKLLAHIKYRITHMLCPTLYAAITNELLVCIF